LNPNQRAPEIDFTSAAMRHRLLQGGGRGQALAKAVGLSKGRSPHIIDATAGLGRDGFILAHLGANIIMIERHPAVANALQKALEQARTSEVLFAEPANRIQLLPGDARVLLPKELPEVIYIDPMHPKRTKSALVKKNLRDLRDLVGADEDSADLIRIALRCAQNRVTLKWPKNAALPDGLPKPSFEQVGKTTRYAIFLA